MVDFLDFVDFCLDMLFFSVCVSNTCATAENNTSRIRLGRVFQIVSVRCQRVAARTTRSQVDDNLV